MSLLVGYLISLAAIFGGFMLEGGHIGAMVQPFELLMIAGGAFGAFFASTFPKGFGQSIKGVWEAMRGSRYTKGMYFELLSLLNEMFTQNRRSGMASLEDDLDAPEDSAVFAKYPMILRNRHVLEFITDYMRLTVMAGIDTHQLENLMDVNIETHEREMEGPIHAITRVADGMPAFGIVAAVMGVVHTMASVDQPPAVLGRLVGAALVGTFLGILIGYAILSPIAARMEARAKESTKMLESIKVALLATMNGYQPRIALEFSRKVLYSSERPGFSELELHLRDQTKKSKDGDGQESEQA